MPSPMYRDSLFNDDVNYQFDRGCGGLGAILGPCGNITSIFDFPSFLTPHSCCS